MNILNRLEWWLKMAMIFDLMFLVIIGVLVLMSVVRTEKNTDIVVQILSKQYASSTISFIPFNE